MDDLSSIEEKLCGLAPPAISDEGQARMEEIIDLLAGESEGTNGTWSGSSSSGKSWTWKVAAAMALFAVPVVMVTETPEDAPVTPLVMNSTTEATSVSETLTDLILLRSTYRIDGQEDDGLIIPADGGAPHYRYRYHVTNEERVRDSETGTVITLRQPRQEVLTVPVTRF